MDQPKAEQAPGACFFKTLFKSEFKLRQTALGVKNKLHLSPHLAATGLRPTPLSVEIVFHSESGICTIVSQPCFTTRNLRTKLCGIRSQTQKQEFVDPFKSWYLETRADPEMDNRRACPQPFLWQRTQLKSGTVCTVLLGTKFCAFQIQNQNRFFGLQAWGVRPEPGSFHARTEMRFRESRTGWIPPSSRKCLWLGGFGLGFKSTLLRTAAVFVPWI